MNAILAELDVAVVNPIKPSITAVVRMLDGSFQAMATLHE
jgi:hypothetical protein